MEEMYFEIRLNVEGFVSHEWYCHAFSAFTRWFGDRKGIRPIKTEWWDAGVVVCLRRSAGLHTVLLMPLPLASCYLLLQ